jgi:hypothetical protein
VCWRWVKLTNQLTNSFLFLPHQTVARILVDSPKCLALPNFPYDAEDCGVDKPLYVLLYCVLRGKEKLRLLHAPRTVEYITFEQARAQLPAAVARVPRPDLYTPNQPGYLLFQLLTVAQGGLEGLPKKPHDAWASEGWDGDYKSLMLGQEAAAAAAAAAAPKRLSLEQARALVPAAVALMGRPDLYTPYYAGYAAFQRLTVAQGGLEGLPSTPMRAWASEGWDGDYKSLMQGPPARAAAG